MNERFVITLRSGTKRIGIAALQDRGLILERDMLPRDIRVVMSPATDVTAARLDWALRRRGSNALELKLSLQDGDLLAQGIDENALPFGSYWCYLDAEDLKTKRQHLELEEGQTVRITVEIEDDPRRVQLKPNVDGLISAALNLSSSSLDGLQTRDWLASESIGPKRKACLLNTLTKLRCRPSVDSPFISLLRRVFFCAVDRVSTEIDSSVLSRLQALASDPAQPFYADGTPLHPAHKHLLERIDDGIRYRLLSFREEGAPSLHMVIAVPPAGETRYYAEFDIDLANPLQDVAGLIVHALEVVGAARANHLELWKKLRKGREAKYLPYDVVRG